MFCEEACKIIDGEHPADWKPAKIRAIVSANVEALSKGDPSLGPHRKPKT